MIQSTQARKGNLMDDRTIPNRTQRDLLQREPPVLLQQHFQGEVALDLELAARFVSAPLLSVAYFRTTGTRAKQAVARLTSQDGSAVLRVEVDSATRATRFAYGMNDLLGAVFTPHKLSDLDRAQWVDAMKRIHDAESAPFAFLWGSTRWEHDYLIATSTPYFIQLYAFSGTHEAGVRISRETAAQWIAWLETQWKA
jgi:hypothetical protein